MNGTGTYPFAPDCNRIENGSQTANVPRPPNMAPTLSNGKEFQFKGFNRPSSILFAEAFLIENGKIRRVEMIGPSSFFHLQSPWPGGLSGK